MFGYESQDRFPAISQSLADQLLFLFLFFSFSDSIVFLLFLSLLIPSSCIYTRDDNVAITHKD